MSLAAATPATETAGLTLEQWADLAEDDARELVDGRLERGETPSDVHEMIALWLGGLLRAWLAGRGFAGASGSKLAVGPNRGRRADLTAYLPGGERPQAHGLVTVPPDIVIEIVSGTPRCPP